MVLRAAVLQLLCGLCTNTRIALEVIRGRTIIYKMPFLIKIILETIQEKMSIWEGVLALLLDNEEASIVRENSAILLTNLCSHLFNKNVII